MFTYVLLTKGHDVWMIYCKLWNLSLDPLSLDPLRKLRANEAELRWIKKLKSEANSDSSRRVLPFFDRGLIDPIPLGNSNPR